MSKYRNVRTNGYASKREAERAQELELLERAGKIETLRRQVKFELLPKDGKERAMNYIADFTYWIDGNLVVEDVKGFRTPVYKIKRRLMKHVHNIVVLETK